MIMFALAMAEPGAASLSDEARIAASKEKLMATAAKLDAFLEQASRVTLEERKYNRPGLRSIGHCWVEGDWSRCPDSGSALHLSEWSAGQWMLRRELMQRGSYVSEFMPQKGPPTREQHDHNCQGALDRPFLCLFAYLDTGDRDYLAHACQLGEVGSCLLDSLDALAVEATAEQALADLGEQCEKGGAFACAWRAEHVRLHGPSALRAETSGMAQRACTELHEPVACAAAAFTLKERAPQSATAFRKRACTLGNAQSCTGRPDSLADEAVPVVVGPSFYDQEAAWSPPSPLPGYPQIPR